MYSTLSIGEFERCMDHKVTCFYSTQFRQGIFSGLFGIPATVFGLLSSLNNNLAVRLPVAIPVTSVTTETTTVISTSTIYCASSTVFVTSNPPTCAVSLLMGLRELKELAVDELIRIAPSASLP